MNLKQAKQILVERLQHQTDEKETSSRNNVRKEHVGTGMRGDKVRTIRVQAGKVINHVTNKKMKVAQYLRGGIEALWK